MTRTDSNSSTPRNPDLASYDVILVNSSAGKDSQAMLDYLVELADEAGVRDRLVVVHCDLGRMEWAGTCALGREQAEHYGLRYEVISRPQGDLLDQVAQRGKWPDKARRYCTSDHKRGQALKIVTKLHRELLASGTVAGRPTRVLNCLGLRADESPDRRKCPVFKANDRGTVKSRTVDTWLPIHGWSADQVWDRIKASGVRYHWAYDLGMSRLSCVFCVFANPRDLRIAGRANRELLAEYARVEQEIGHTFKQNMRISDLHAELAAEDEAVA